MSETDQHNVQIDSSNPTVIKVDFGLTWRQITIAFGFIAALIGGGAGAGWLVLPASKTDLSIVERSLQTQVEALQAITREVRELQKTSTDTVDAIDELRRDLAALAADRMPESIPAAPQPFGRQRPPVPARGATERRRRPPPDTWRNDARG